MLAAEVVEMAGVEVVVLSVWVIVKVVVMVV